MAADFSLLQPTPNFAAAALSGYQAGALIGRQRRLDEAMSNIDLERPETLLPVLRADPSTGAALIGASMKLASEKRAQKAMVAQAQAFKSFFGNPQAPDQAAPTTDNAPSPTPSTATDPTPSDITVTATPPQPTMGDKVGALLGAGVSPETAMHLVNLVGSLDKTQKERLDDATGAFATVGQQALSMPYEQRRAYIESQTGYLQQHGVTPDHIQGFDPTDAALHGEVSKALGVKDALAQADKDRNFAFDQSKFAETQRHNKVDEGQAASRIGLEAQSVGIAGGHLALDRQKEAREAAKGAAGGGTAPIARTLPNGAKAYRNPANGKWYDNPSFR